MISLAYITKEFNEMKQIQGWIVHNKINKNSCRNATFCDILFRMQWLSCVKHEPLYMNNRRKRTHFFNGFIHCMCQAVCVLFIFVGHDRSSVFVSSSTPTHCVRAHEHGQGIMCECVQMEPIGEQERQEKSVCVCACVSVHGWGSGGLQLYDPGATWHSRFGPAHYIPAGGLVKRLSQIINTYTLIICWNSTSISVDLTNIM